MTEEIAATPGWVDQRLDSLFAALHVSAATADARSAYARCLAAHKQPAAPSDLLGSEFESCRPTLYSALTAAGVTREALKELNTGLELLEAEIASGS